MTKLFDLDKHFGRRGKYTEPTNEEISNLKESKGQVISFDNTNFTVIEFSNKILKLSITK